MRLANKVDANNEQNFSNFLDTSFTYHHEV
jgi:hypothetical protein